MKALTLTDPWATLVALDKKKIETRSWKTRYRGPLAIHAAKGFPNSARDLCWTYPFADALTDFGAKGNVMFSPGCVVATCELVSIIPTSQLQLTPVWEWDGPQGRHYRYELTEQERAFGDYTPLRWAWLLADIKPLATPVPTRGALSLWEWEPIA